MISERGSGWRGVLVTAWLSALSTTASGFPVTIDSCGQQEVFEKAPVRAVSIDVNITETLLALDLQRQMAGYAGISDLSKLAPEFRDKLNGVPELARKYPSLEILIGAGADFYFAGWNYGMKVGGDVTPETLLRFGIKSYAIRESCIQVGPRSAIQLEDMFEDTIAISQIFGVEARAHILVEGLKQRLAAVAAITSKARQRWRVFVYDSGEDAPETAGRYAMPTALIEAAGARNVMDDVEASWTTVNWEAVLRRDPQFIVIIDYGDVTAAQKIAFLRQAPALAAVDAVQQGRFVILPYDAATPGVRNIDAVEILAHAFNAILP